MPAYKPDNQGLQHHNMEAALQNITAQLTAMMAKMTNIESGMSELNSRVSALEQSDRNEYYIDERPQIEDESVVSARSSISSGDSTFTTASKKRKNMSPTHTSIPTSNKFAILENNIDNDDSMETEFPPLPIQRPKITPIKINRPTPTPPNTSQPAPSTSQSTNPTPLVSNNSASNTTNKSKIPPIMLNNPADFNFVKDFCSRNSIALVRCKSAGTRLSVVVDTPSNYRKLTSHLIQSKKSFHHYSLKEDLPLKVVLRGWPVAIETSVALNSLREEGFHPLKVARMNRSITKTPMPLLFVEVPQNESHIMDLKVLNSLVVSVEKPNPKKSIAQCHRCQSFNHSQANCYAPPKCVKCAGSHLTMNCTRQDPNQSPKCCNCGGDHPASFRSCPRFPKPKTTETQNKPSSNPTRTFTPNPLRSGVSFAAATSGNKPTNNSIPKSQPTLSADILAQIPALIQLAVSLQPIIPTLTALIQQ